MFARFPLMSHSAMSTPLIALKSDGPLRQYELIYDDCQTSSISSTLRPIRKGFRYFSTAVWTTKARWVNVAHPQPCRPGSVVSTLTMTRRMRSGAVRIVLMSLILTGASPLREASSCGVWFCNGSANPLLVEIIPAPAAALDRKLNASLRFIVFPLFHGVECSAFHLVGLALVETVFAQKIFGDVDAQPGRGHRIDRSLVSLPPTHDNLAEDGLVRLEELKDQEVRDREAGVHRSDCADGAVRIMWRNRHVIRIGHRRDLLELRDAAGARNVRLNDPHGLPLEQFAETVPSEDAFACRQRDVHHTLHFGHRRYVLRRDGFFVKEQSEGFERADDLNCGFGIPAAVDVNGNVII